VVRVSFIGNCVGSVRRHGLGVSASRYWTRLREQLYERCLGVRSSDIISLRELGLEHEERREHYPISVEHFRRMERFLRPRTRDEVFLDYGAGLGRVLVLAAMLPFKRVIGVELSPVLAKRARENLSRCERRFRCKSVQIVVADATAFEMPRDVTMIYFNNPFAGEILERVLNRIMVSHQQSPRSMRLVCDLPRESAFHNVIK